MDINKLNIFGIDVESKIREAICFVNQELDNLTRERTCFIYSSYVYNYLRNAHVSVRLINTEDLNSPLAHQFVLVPLEIGKYYLIDLTFSQFPASNTLSKLLLDGYQLIDESGWEEYKFVIGFNNNINLEDTFWYQPNKGSR